MFLSPVRSEIIPNSCFCQLVSFYLVRVRIFLRWSIKPEPFFCRRFSPAVQIGSHPFLQLLHFCFFSRSSAWHSSWCIRGEPSVVFRLQSSQQQKMLGVGKFAALLGFPLTLVSSVAFFELVSTSQQAKGWCLPWWMMGSGKSRVFLCLKGNRKRQAQSE